MSSVSIQGPRSIFQSSIAAQNSIADQGTNEFFSLKNLNEKFLFPFYDELLRMVKLHSIFSVILVIVFIDQIFVSMSFYLNNNIANFFSNFNINSTYEMISFPIIYLVVNLAFFTYLFFNFRSKRLFNYWQLYLASVFLNFLNVIIFVPVCGACGYSVYQLDQVINLHHSELHVSMGDYHELGNYSVFAKNILNRRFILNEINRSTISFFHNNFLQLKSNINLNNNETESIFASKSFEQNGIFGKIINIINNFTNINNNFSIYDDPKEPDEPKPPDILENSMPPDNPNDHTPDDDKEPPPDDHNEALDFDYDEAHIKLILNRDFSQHAILIIIFLIEGFILYFELLTNYHFMCESPYLNRTIFSMWDCQVFLSYLLLIGINQFFYYFLKILPNWCTLLYQILILIAIIYVMYYTFFQPFIHVFTNTFFQSALTTFFLTTFFSFLLYLKFTIIVYFFIVLSGFFFFIFLIVYQAINKTIIKKINKKLSPPQNPNESIDESTESNDSQSSKRANKRINRSKNEQKNENSMDDSKPEQIELSENEKREMFDSYVFQSIEHALLYFRVGVSMASPYFVDFSFIRYMKEFYGQKPIQLFILQLSALFPSQHQFFNFCMTTYCKKVEFFNMYENFIIYQLHRINIIRQSSVSKEVQSELFRLEKMSDDSVSAIRGFWTELIQAKTEFNTASLGFIRRMTLNTKSNYIDAIEKFPNSQQILNSYCRFLCEACGDYIECARIGQKMRLIEQGKNANADHCFHSFVNVFPHYLKKRILNIHGTFIMNSNSFSASQSSTSISTGRLSASFDNARGMPIEINANSNNFNSPLSIKKRYKDEFENLIEQEHFESLINSLFTNAKQRLTIQTIVDRSKNRALSFARLIAFIQCLISVIVIVTTFSYVSSGAKTIELMESATRISKISSCFDYCSLIAGIQFFSEYYMKNVTASMIENLHIRSENIPQFSCSFILPVISMNIMKLQIVELFDEELKYLMQNPEDHTLELALYTAMDYIGEAPQEESETESQSKAAQSMIRNLQRINKAFLKKSIIKNEEGDDNNDGDYDYDFGNGDGDGDAGDGDHNGGDYGSSEGGDNNNNNNNNQYDYAGVIMYKFFYAYPFSFVTTLRNAFDYVQSSVERLAYLKSMYILEHNYPDKPPGQNPFGSYVNLSKYRQLHKLNLEEMNPKFDYTDDYDYYFRTFFDAYFEILANSISLSTPFHDLYKAISVNSIDIASKYSLKIRIVSEAVLIVFFIIFVGIRIYNHVIIKQISKVSSYVMKRVKGEEIAQAMKPIYLKSKKGIKIHSATTHSIFEYSPTLLILTIVGFTSIVVFIVFYSAAILVFIRSFNFVEKTFEWARNGSTRFLSLSSILNWVMIEKSDVFGDSFIVSDLLMLYYFDLNQMTRNLDLSIIGRDKELDKFYFMINEHSASKTIINQTNSTTNSTNSTKTSSKYPFRFNSKKKTKSTEYDYNFDRFRKEMEMSNTKCTDFDNSNESTQMNFATYLDCISLDSKINLAIHYYFLLDKVIQDVEPENLIDTPEFIALLFILDKYLYRDMPEFQDKILEILEVELKSQKNIVYIIGTFGLVFAIIFFLIELCLIRSISLSYDAFKQLLMVLPPASFANNQFLINFLINTCSRSKLFVKISRNSIINTLSKLSHHRDNVLSEEEILVNSTEHAVVTTCKNLIIQSVNPAVQKMTGFPSDQLLGQGLIYLIPLISRNNKTRVASIEKSSFYQRLEEIRSNSGDRVAEVNTTCLTDKGDEILVQATIIGIFEKKCNLYRKIDNNNNIKKLPFSKLVREKKEFDSDSDTSENTSASTTASTINSATTSTNNLTLFGHLNNNNVDDDDDEEEFVGSTIILKDISDELRQKKEVKEAKKKTEALINFMIPQPVLEQIRTSRKKQFYTIENATIVKIEFCGLDEYIGSIMPKQIMTCLQSVYSKICSISNNEERILFNGRKEKNKKNPDNLFENINSQTASNDGHNFHFNFSMPIETEFSPRRENENKQITNRIDYSQINKQKNENDQNEDDDEDEEIINDDDDDCDFGCVFIIRNDIDNFISISGLFDSQNQPKKQAESCLRYALKVRQIIENISLEEQFNLFIHAKIVVCMGGPIDGIIDDPEIPNLEVFSNLFNKADLIKKDCDIDTVYIDENVYNNIIKDNYQIEEKLTMIGSDDDDHHNMINGGIKNDKIYVVSRCLIKKKNDMVPDNNVVPDNNDDDGVFEINES